MILQLSCAVVWGHVGGCTGDACSSAGGFTETCFISSLRSW